MIRTLVDITQTNATRNDEKERVLQQANYNTVIQVLGLRVNIVPIACTSRISDMDRMYTPMGTNFSGKQRVWEFIFEVDYEGATSIEIMQEDFDFIPIITELQETASNNNKVFNTRSKTECNITFDALSINNI